MTRFQPSPAGRWGRRIIIAAVVAVLALGVWGLAQPAGPSDDERCEDAWASWADGPVDADRPPPLDEHWCVEHMRAQARDRADLEDMRPDGGRTGVLPDTRKNDLYQGALPPDQRDGTRDPLLEAADKLRPEDWEHLREVMRGGSMEPEARP